MGLAFTITAIICCHHLLRIREYIQSLIGLAWKGVSPSVHLFQQPNCLSNIKIN